MLDTSQSTMLLGNQTFSDKYNYDNELMIKWYIFVILQKYVLMFHIHREKFSKNFYYVEIYDRYILSWEDTFDRCIVSLYGCSDTRRGIHSCGDTASWVRIWNIAMKKTFNLHIFISKFPHNIVSHCQNNSLNLHHQNSDE